MTRQVCIALHDVAPATWPQCAALLGMLDAFGAPPVTLLVVPDWHGRGRIDTAPEFIAAIEQRRARGDEIALHGYFHRDDSPAPRTPTAHLRRRVLTAGEGEFADLPSDVAEARLRQGLELFERLRWHVQGFVPPAWLAGPGARRALQRVPLRWTSTHTALIDLARERRIAAPCLTASPRSAWRRTASRAWLHAASRITRDAPLVRIGLHPGDADHAEMTACWRDVLAALLASREALTKSAAIEAMTLACAA
jgi:predicted deacetylase